MFFALNIYFYVESITGLRRQARRSRWHLWRVWLLVATSVASVAGVAALLAVPSPVRHDVFEAKPLQEYLGDFEGTVHADTDCVPVDNNTKLNCIAIILRNGKHEEYDYTHDIEIPCLARGEQVRVKGDQLEVLITRLSEPKMVHS